MNLDLITGDRTTAKRKLSDMTAEEIQRLNEGDAYRHEKVRVSILSLEMSINVQSKNTRYIRYVENAGSFGD